MPFPQENIDLFDFTISTEDIATLEAVNRNFRACVPTIKVRSQATTDREIHAQVDGVEVPRDRNHPHFPFHEAF